MQHEHCVLPKPNFTHTFWCITKKIHVRVSPLSPESFHDSV